MKKLLNVFKKISIAFVSLVLLGGGCNTIDIPTFSENYDVLRLKNRDNTSYFIAHAMGSVVKDGKYITGTNGLEAFEYSYAQGFRYFEVDFSLTKDEKMVALHDGAEPHIKAGKKIDEMTHQEFMTHKFFDRYTLLDLDTIVNMIQTHPDVFIVTDFKSDFEKSLMNLNKLPEIIRQHFIIQMYEFDQIDLLKKYKYSNVILTLYRIQDIPDDKIITFVQNNPEIDAVTIRWPERYSEDLARRVGEEGLATYVHTVNDEVLIQEFVQKEVGVYTDYADVGQYMKWIEDQTSVVQYY